MKSLPDKSTIIYDIEGCLSSSRYKHSLGVAETAIKLAEKVSVDPYQAEIAGLLHDYAKHFNQRELFKLIDIYNLIQKWDIDDVELNIPVVLHAPVGAYLVKKNFNVNDRNFLEAIRFHAIGKPGMSKLAQIIFLADLIEPNRDFPGVKKIREIVDQSIKQALIAACDQLLKYNIDQQRIIHPNTLLLRNDYLGG